MLFLYRLWGYALPFPIWLAEQFVRASMVPPDGKEFFPPSLAALALGMTIQILTPIVPFEKFLPLTSEALTAIRHDEAVRMARRLGSRASVGNREYTFRSGHHTERMEGEDSMDLQTLINNGGVEMAFLALGIAAIGVWSTYIDRKRAKSDEYLIINTTTGLSERILINQKLPVEDRRRVLREKLDKLCV